MNKWKNSRVKSIRLLKKAGNFFDNEIEQICEVFLAEAPTKQGKKVKKTKKPFNIDSWFPNLTESLNRLTIIKK